MASGRVYAEVGGGGVKEEGITIWKKGRGTGGLIISAREVQYSNF